jgi:hypothetical protein
MLLVVAFLGLMFSTSFAAGGATINMQINQGGVVPKVAAASTAAAAADKALVVSVSPNTPVIVNATLDPCMDPNVAKSSVALSVVTATTTALVATSTTKTIYVCGVSATMSGTSPTATFITGTTVSNPCDTGASGLTGAMTPSATVGSINIGWGGTSMKTAAGGALCVTTAATTAIYGVLSYVQK